MTREEAIEILKDAEMRGVLQAKLDNALKIAIEALKEGCDEKK